MNSRQFYNHFYLDQRGLLPLVVGLVGLKGKAVLVQTQSSECLVLRGKPVIGPSIPPPAI